MIYKTDTSFGATVLAALRMWQQASLIDRADFSDIYTDGGRVRTLSAHELDQFIYQFNLGGSGVYLGPDMTEGEAQAPEPTPRSSLQIVREANALAGKYAKLAGWEGGPGLAFFKKRTTRHHAYWEQARLAMIHLQQTDPDDALSDLDDDEIEVAAAAPVEPAVMVGGPTPRPAPAAPADEEFFPAHQHPLAEERERGRAHREQARHGLGMSSRMVDDLKARFAPYAPNEAPSVVEVFDMIRDITDILAAHQYALADEFHVPN